MRRVVVTAASAVVLVLGMGIPAHAGKAVGGCPDHYQLTKTFKNDPVDLNGDGYVCEQGIPSTNPNPGGQGATLAVDNTVPLK